MDDLGIGAGLAAMAFWGFVAVVVVATFWDGIRKRETQHQTLRQILESGQKIDTDVLDKLMSITDNTNKRLDQDLKVTALWLMPVAVGLAALAIVLGSEVPAARTPILAAASLVAVLAVGFFIGGKIAERWYDEEQTLTPDHLED
jgi:hypothetical protein